LFTLRAIPDFHKFLQRLFDAETGEGEMLSPEILHELVFLRNLNLDQKRVHLRPLPAAERVCPAPPPRTTIDRSRGAACVALLTVLLLLPVP